MTDVQQAPSVDVDERGTLDLRVKAIQRIVEQTVRRTPGTVAHRSTLGRFTGSNTPKATVTLHANSARVAVQVACVWPCPVARVVAQVRDTVMAEATRMTGVYIRSVDITIVTLSPDDLDPAERRRVR